VVECNVVEMTTTTTRMDKEVRMRSTRLRGVGLLLAGALVLVGCSGDADGDGDDAGDGGASDADITATAAEYQFAPATWTVSAGEFSVELVNGGTVEHEWAVIALGEDIESGEEFAEEKVLLEVEAIDAGDSTTESFTIDEPGTYQVICALDGHFGEGMEGTLTVE